MKWPREVALGGALSLSTLEFPPASQLHPPCLLNSAHRVQALGVWAGNLPAPPASSPATQVPSGENETFPPHLPWKCPDTGSVLMRLFGEHAGMLVASLAHTSHLSDSLTSWPCLMLFLKARKMSTAPKQ